MTRAAKSLTLLLRVGTLGTLLALWWLIAKSVDADILLPGPVTVAERVIDSRETIMTALSASLVLYVTGLAIAIVIGILLGSLLGVSRTFGAMFDPIVNALYVTPRIILVPLIIGWFGIFTAGKIVLVFAICVFEVLLFTRDGIRTMGDHYAEVGRVFRAGPLQMLGSVYLSGAMPSILTGLRLAAGRGVIGVVIAEFFMAIFAPTDGVAALVRLSASQFRTADALGGVAVLITFGVIAQALVAVFERRHVHKYAGAQ